jgi:hypothetical protein
VLREAVITHDRPAVNPDRSASNRSTAAAAAAVTLAVILSSGSSLWLMSCGGPAGACIW